MRQTKHLYQTIFRIIKYIILYLLSILLLILVFGLIYRHSNVVAPFQTSIDVIWGSSDNLENVHNLAVIQKIIYDVFLVLFIGTFVTQQLKPVNPIAYSKVAVHDDLENRYYFRYWAILPLQKYLFDVKIRLAVTTYEELNNGVNKLHTWFEKEDTYNSIRGVRFLMLEGKKSKKFRSAIEADHNRLISLYIIGTNEEGITYASVKRYHFSDIKTGYRFVSVRKSEFIKTANDLKDTTDPKKLRRVEKKKKRMAKKADKDTMKYQYFDKLYLIPGKTDAEEVERKYVLSKEQILYGQYRGPRQWALNIIDWISTLALERNVFSFWRNRE